MQTVTDDVESISTDTVNLYVSDKNSDDPNTYIDLATALAAADKIDKQEKQVIITMKGGTYEIDKTVTISAKSNGSEKYPLIIKAEDGENVVLDAGKKVHGTKIDRSQREDF